MVTASHANCKGRDMDSVTLHLYLDQIVQGLVFISPAEAPGRNDQGSNLRSLRARAPLHPCKYLMDSTGYGIR